MASQKMRLILNFSLLVLALFSTACGRIWGGVTFEGTTPNIVTGYSCNYAGFLIGNPITPFTPLSLGAGTYSVTPALPSGLTLNSSTGTISGTPTGTTAITAYTLSGHSSGGVTTTAKINIQTDTGYLVNDLVHDSDTAGAGCTSGFGTCTIRAAIDSPTPPNLIVLPAGTTTLTTGTALTVANAATIYGDCTQGTILDGNNSQQILHVNAGSINVYNLTFQHAQNAGPGGAINVQNGLQATIVNSNFLNNTLAGGNNGVAINVWFPANLTVVGSAFYNNTALAGTGGAIGASGAGGQGLITLINDTFSANAAQQGSVIFGGTYNITNSTFSQNSTSGCCTAAITSNGTLNFTSNIFYGNFGGIAANCENTGGTFSSLGNNLTDNNGADCSFGGLDFLNTTALLGPLQNNGGLTLTQALLPGSPAIDQGNTTACSATASSIDQRGYPRLVDGKCDIGAYETSP